MLFDLRVVVRTLLKSPTFTSVALLTLALGIGVNTAMFGVVNALLLQPAPYPASEQLVRVFRTASQSQSLPHSLPDFADELAQSQVFTSLTAYQGWSYSLAEPGQPAEHLNGITASAGLFSTLGIQPSLGRGFTAAEQQPGRDRVAVLSSQLWRRRFGGDPHVIGRSLRIDGENVTVIGVMPERAAYPIFWGQVDVWRPLRLSDDWRQLRSVYWLNIIGRLRSGVRIEQARTEMSGIVSRLARQFPGTNTGAGLRIIPLHESAIAETGRRVTLLTLGLAGFVLLIACANLANLQLARAAANARAAAIRVALGASRASLIRQSLVESVLLAVVGGALGLLLASWLNQVLGSRVAIGGSGLAIPLDLTVLGFAFLTSLGAGVTFGTVPAWVASRTDASAALKQQTRGSTPDRSQHRLRHGLVVAGIALTLVLLSGAGLFLRGLQRFAQRDLGWQPTGLLTGTITLPDSRYPGSDQRRAFHERLLQRVAVLPGVERAALASFVPFSASNNSPLAVYVDARPAPAAGKEPLVNYTVVSPQFFDALEVKLVAGRLFTDNLRPDSPGVIVVNETMARLLWPGEDPIGKRISRSSGNRQWDEVIGVGRDVRFAADLGAPETRMQAYRPLVLEPWGYITIILRAAAPETLAEPLRRAIAELDPDLPVDVVRTVNEAVDQSQRYFHLANEVLGGFALLGLLLSAIGLYGVMAGIVARRTGEFGLRLALGARAPDVLWLVLGVGLRLALLGVALGFIGSLGLAQLLRGVASELPAQDPWVILGVGLLLVAVALLACLPPARRATRVDPMVALRSE